MLLIKLNKIAIYCLGAFLFSLFGTATGAQKQIHLLQFCQLQPWMILEQNTDKTERDVNLKHQQVSNIRLESLAVKQYLLEKSDSPFTLSTESRSETSVFPDTDCTTSYNITCQEHIGNASVVTGIRALFINDYHP